MMIKCQKCGFENQMGSIFCRECGEKLNMDAIDPNKLQKDVDKEKRIKRTKKQVKSLISTLIGLIILAAFLGVIFYNGGLREYEAPTVNAASVNQKYNAALKANGVTQFSYAELNELLKSKVVEPLAAEDSFTKVTAAEVAYDAEKSQPVFYLWISIKDKVPVIYTIRGNLKIGKAGEGELAQISTVSLDVDRLDIGRLPIFYRSDIFLDGFSPVIEHEAVFNLFSRAKDVEFDENGMKLTVSGTPVAGNSLAPSSGAAASNASNIEKAEAARQAAEEKKQKQEEAKRKAEEAKREREEKAKQLAEERKQKQEEAKQKQEEARREREEKQRQLEEERRQRAEEAKREREERQRERERERNNGYNNRNSSRNSSRRSGSRNRY